MFNCLKCLRQEFAPTYIPVPPTRNKYKNGIDFSWAPTMCCIVFILVMILNIHSDSLNRHYLPDKKTRSRVVSMKNATEWLSSKAKFTINLFSSASHGHSITRDSLFHFSIFILQNRPNSSQFLSMLRTLMALNLIFLLFIYLLVLFCSHIIIWKYKVTRRVLSQYIFIIVYIFIIFSIIHHFFHNTSNVFVFYFLIS